MQNPRLHIISFDNPHPPVYGGTIDVFYKIRALHKLGYEIYLHCYVDRKSEADEALRRHVKKVYFYRRNKKNALKLFSIFPFAVVSRFKKKLVANLKRNEAPILFEGLQTTYLLKHHDFADRKLLLRLHNLEANYFLGQSRSETNPAKKFAYFSEYLKYKLYQKHIAKFNSVLTLSVFEHEYVAKRFGNAVYVPVFHGNKNVAALYGIGKYAFYHGDLRLADNRRAVKFLVKVFDRIPGYQLLVASGCNASFVEDLIAQSPNISYVAIESQEHLTRLLHDAHINVMLSFQESGTKLKLVNALYRSRHCIINANMVDDPALRELCTMAETEVEFVNAVKELIDKPYSDAERRQDVLDSVLDDIENAKKIQQLLES
jgi:glycosyltransferase involved in cell wall biosynthesis